MACLIYLTQHGRLRLTKQLIIFYYIHIINIIYLYILQCVARWRTVWPTRRNSMWLPWYKPIRLRTSRYYPASHPDIKYIANRSPVTSQVGHCAHRLKLAISSESRRKSPFVKRRQSAHHFVWPQHQKSKKPTQKNKRKMETTKMSLKRKRSS